MDRLTEQKNGINRIKNCEIRWRYVDGIMLQKAIDRLAQYEGTGILPEQINAQLTEIEILKAKNEVYRKHWLDLCDGILAEIDKDGWCRLSMTSDDAVRMKGLLEELGESE